MRTHGLAKSSSHPRLIVHFAADNYNFSNQMMTTPLRQRQGWVGMPYHYLVFARSSDLFGVKVGYAKLHAQLQRHLEKSVQIEETNVNLNK